VTTKYILQTFEDIVDACLEELGADSNDLKTVNRIKRDINSVYLQEIVPESNWYWLTRSTEVQAKAYTSTGTATFTSGSATVTTSEAFGQCYRGYYISSEGYNEVYRIAQHTAGSQTLTLETPFGGTTVASATFKIWTDTLALPADCMKTSEIRHSFRNVPLEGVGRKEFRKMSSTAPRAEARPECYCTGNIVDPVPFDDISGLPASTYRSSSGLVRTVVFASTLGTTGSTSIMPGDRIEVSGAGNYRYNGTWLASSVSTTSATNDTITFTAEENYTESSTADTAIVVKKAPGADSYSRYRELMIWPALFSANTTLYVDYLVEPQPLVEDDDEPLIPLEDRNVLLYGALSRSWVKVRDEDTANRNAALYEKKLAKMSGRIEDSLDLPQIRISPQYLRGKRRTGKSYGTTIPDTLGFAIGGGASSITGTPNRVAIFDTDGRLVSDSVVSKTELEYLDGVTSPIQTQIDALNTLADGKIYVGNSSNIATEVTPSGDVTLTDTGVTTVNKIQTKTVSGTTGTGNVVFSASPSLTGTATAQALHATGATQFDDTLGVSGAATLGSTLGVTGAITALNLTASLPVFTNGSKALVSNAMTGTGNVVMSASPTLTGTVSAANETLSGTLGVTGVATFTAQPVMSSLTASQAVFTDGSKGLVSNAVTGTGSVAMSASPTFTGTVGAAAITSTGTIKAGAYLATAITEDSSSTGTLSSFSAPTGIVDFSASTTLTINSIAAASDGAYLTLINRTGNNMTINSLSATGSVNILCPGNTNMTVANFHSVTMVYASSYGHWIVISFT
jgi:hypothetical protein